ncbi:hypothetical protein KL948_002342 [Ogataea haglerorum]|nr:hypothetical protein KL948_002342 [Ogataea haglerorum]
MPQMRLYASLAWQAGRAERRSAGDPVWRIVASHYSRPTAVSGNLIASSQATSVAEHLRPRSPSTPRSSALWPRSLPAYLGLSLQPSKTRPWRKLRQSNASAGLRGSELSPRYFFGTTIFIYELPQQCKHQPAMSDSISVKSGESQYSGFDSNVETQVRGLARELSHVCAGETEKNDNDARSLIRTLTNYSQVPGVNPFVEDGVDARLNPDSDDFDAKLWIQNMRKLMDSDPDYYKPASLSVAFRNLRARGVVSSEDYQTTILTAPIKFVMEKYNNTFRKNVESRYFDILKPMDGLILPGTFTLVLGRPGAGCSTFLKAISSQTYGFEVAPESVISYDGFSPKDIRSNYRGEVTFSAEKDEHFPQLTVRQTLGFAAKLKAPRNRPQGVSAQAYADHMTKVYMAMYGLSHTADTKVGNDFVKGVSGGERKRVSTAELSLCGSKIQCWDNSTRGLDSATALEFLRALKTSATVLQTTPVTSVYQCSTDSYNLFDNVLLLYEGYQIYYGPAAHAKQFFQDMGYVCPPRQTTADFLTSLTSPKERITREGMEHRVPRTPKEFNDYWRASPEYADMVAQTDAHIKKSVEDDLREQFHQSHVARQEKGSRPRSPYTSTYWTQVRENMRRYWWKIKGDPSLLYFHVFSRVGLSLVISSLYYNLKNTTSDLYYRGACMFFATIFNAMSMMMEVIVCFEARQIAEKHKKYALYHPSTDALASVITEIPNKLVVNTAFNLVFYFMVNFRRTPGHFFFYLLTNLTSTLTMSHMMRSLVSLFRTLSGALTPAMFLVSMLVLYTGFAVPVKDMHGWSRWLNYLDPIAYAFEALIANEFHGREFVCNDFIPGYSGVPRENTICNTLGAEAGETTISGTRYIALAYKYYAKHKWRNWGINLSFAIFFLGVYLILVENSKSAMQKGDVLLFLSNWFKAPTHARAKSDIETANKIESVNFAKDEAGSTSDSGGLATGNGIFHWRDVSFDIKVGNKPKRILDHVDGWVKPGTLTALMGASGAGKTTLLDVLANRVTIGVVTGSIFVNGKERNQSFQRFTGYAQQQDLHIQTATVRESLRFSAYLRQDASVSKQEKDDYVEEIIRVLEMESYADAVVGEAGQGLNIEQRKRLTIGVELVAKPQLLLFLDEPTSGLDSQTAWSICQLLRKLSNSGQAILCTIHQPSARLLQEFDRLLFLAAGGKTVYFGELGPNCKTLIDYFEKNGAEPCPVHANPAEWMLEVIGAAPGSHAQKDYHEVWTSSPERAAVLEELHRLEEVADERTQHKETKQRQFATPFATQYLLVTKRMVQQYIRTPSYIYSKLLMAIGVSMFNGFTFFHANHTKQGLQNQMLSIYLMCTSGMVYFQQLLPLVEEERNVYEVRERPSKLYSWYAFVSATFTAELPWSFITGTLSFVTWYLPLGLYRDAEQTHSVSERAGLVWLLLTFFYIYATTLGYFCSFGLEVMSNGMNNSFMVFMLSMNFSGVLVYPTGFWTWLYHVSPLTWWIGGIVPAGIRDTRIRCASDEYVKLPPLSGQTCGQYMQEFITKNGGYVVNPDATDMCEFCSMSNSNQFLLQRHMNPDHMWRNFGLMVAYSAFNIICTYAFYYVFRVPKKRSRVEKETFFTEEAEDEKAAPKKWWQKLGKKN